MTWPLLERELRAALRKPQLQQTRTWGTLICAGVAILFLLIGGASGAIDWGRNFNQLLFWGGLIIIMQVPTYTVGIFAEERRNQTLGLLFLCGISPVELFLGKTLGSALVSFSRLLIVYPFLAFAFIGGGLSLEVFVATIISLPVLLLFVFAVCVLASVLCQEESTAMFVAVLLGALFCVTTPLVHSLATLGANQNSSTAALLVLSPARPTFLAAKNLIGGTMGEFFTAIALSVIWSVLLLFIAGFVLSRVWQDKPDMVLAGTRRARWRDLLHGDAGWRKMLFGHWSETNPYVWLVARDRWLIVLAWIVVGSVMLLGVGACVVWPGRWMCPSSFFLTAIILNYALNWISIFAAAKTIGDNRRSGGLELLLTTPLNHLDIVRGQMVALREQFRPVAWAVIIFEVVLCAIGLATRSWTAGSLTVYLIIWVALIIWTASFLGSFRNALPVFWDSLVCGRPAFVALRRSGFNGSPAWIGYFVFVGGNVVRGLARDWKYFPVGSFQEYVLCVVGLIVLIWTRKLGRTTLKGIEARLATDFRALAAKPVPEPSDPGYKSWKSGEHFPGMYIDVLEDRAIRHPKQEPTRTGTGR